VLAALLPRCERQRQLHEWQDQLDCTRATNGDLRRELIELIRSAPAIAWTTMPYALRVSLAALASAMIATLLFWPTPQSRQQMIGVATANIVLDSQTNTVSLPRARFLAMMMASAGFKDQIARRAHIAPDSLIVSLSMRDAPTSTLGDTHARLGDPDARVTQTYPNDVVKIAHIAHIALHSPIVSLSTRGAPNSSARDNTHRRLSDPDAPVLQIHVNAMAKTAPPNQLQANQRPAHAALRGPLAPRHPRSASPPDAHTPAGTRPHNAATPSRVRPNELAMITAYARAPTPAAAAAIASAAMTELNRVLPSAPHKPHDKRALIVKKLGPTKSAAVPRRAWPAFKIVTRKAPVAPPAPGG
jgi:hypothetical protein